MDLRSIGTIVLIAATANLALAQHSIFGKVLDARTGAPVEFASVFLAGTSFGVSADSLGRFAIHSVPIGKYELTSSSVGYQIKKVLVVVSDVDISADISMTPDQNILSEVTVETKRHYTPPHLIDEFRKYFLGETRNAGRCRIRNPEVITATMEEQLLTAVAGKPIIIDNRSLGYTIEYYLRSFEVDFAKNIVKFTGVSHFEKMKSKNKREEERWEEERLRAYKGSILHFIRTLNAKSLKGSGFTVYGADHNLIAEEIYQNNASDEVSWTGKLVIVYKESPEIYYPGPPYGDQVSDLKLTAAPLHIYSNGYYDNPLSLEVNGYLGWADKIADMVPFDYVPAIK